MSTVPRSVAAGFAESSQKYYVELHKAKALLKAAKCPNGDCIAGLLMGRLAENQQQCQWCAEREEVIRG